MCLYGNDRNERELHHTYVTLTLSSARLKEGPLRGWVWGVVVILGGLGLQLEAGLRFPARG